MKIFTTKEELIEYVCSEYRNNDAELTYLFFDVDVKMSKADILEAFAECQYLINEDECARIESGIEQDKLAPEDFNEIYEGNCSEFLLSLNDDPRFVRYYEKDEKCPDFVW